MDERLSRVESAVEELSQRFADLERRVAAIEPVTAAASTAKGEPARPPALTPAAAPDAVAILALIGRTLIILGGGYLLRALTEAGALPGGAGAAFGLAYAGLMLLAADRAGGRGRNAAATACGVAATLLAYPLLWEITARFALVGPAGSAAALAAFTGAALLVAWRRRAHAFAWAATLGGLAASVGLLVATRATIPYAAFLVALGVATLWLGYDREWKLLRWPVALAADFAAVGLILRALSDAPSNPPGLVVTVLLALVGAYLASIAARTLARGRDVIPFEVVQTGAALVVGLGGAVAVSRGTGIGTAGLGASSLVLGALSYAVAFAFVDKRQGRGRNFYFYTSLGIVFTLVGGRLLLSGGAQVAVWAGLAALTGWLGARFARLALSLHSAVYLSAAAFQAGMSGSVIAALAGGASGPWTLPTAGALLVLGGGVLCAAAGRCAEREGARWLSGVARLVVATILVGVGGGVLISSLVAVLSVRGAVATPGMVATTRTVVLALASIALAWSARFDRLREWGWLVYPVLLGTALKLVVEDLRVSPASVLFIALAAYGIALALAPRLLRSGARFRVLASHPSAEAG